jgi:hypothetical protein
MKNQNLFVILLLAVLALFTVTSVSFGSTPIVGAVAPSSTLLTWLGSHLLFIGLMAWVADEFALLVGSKIPDGWAKILKTVGVVGVGVGALLALLS